MEVIHKSQIYLKKPYIDDNKNIQIKTVLFKMFINRNKDYIRLQIKITLINIFRM